MAASGPVARVTTRWMLVASSLVALGGFAGAIAIGNSVSAVGSSDAWIGLLGICLAGAAVFGAGVSFVHAGRIDRNGPAWAVGSFLFPYIAPLVLAVLPPTSRAVVRGGADGGQLRALLIGKWVCQCGVIHSDGRDGAVCNDCGKPLLRFHPGERGQSCAVCGFRFSDVDVTTEDTMQEVWARKGFRCNACGDNVCLSCLPRGRDGEPAYRCPCGGSLAIRV
jgi:hypothetical protein